MDQVRIVVRGDVQGVGFRFATRRMAAALGLRGYVRNQPDGDVEIVAEGERERLDALVRWARRGPPAAHVEGLDVSYGEGTGAYYAFSIASGGSW
ncbi:MAG TPA: acylphosphatase [Chthonomonadales bacterium]|nr:acylphosphatase [Chthonomonadales bacterium]